MTDEQEFWTITLEHIGQPERTLTLCEPCALSATNAASRISDFTSEPFPDMPTAVLVMDAMLAMCGMETSGITSQHLGQCESCGHKRRK